jgi:cell division GTPase FtsZ
MGMIAIGVGTAGCRILSQLHHSSTIIERFVYVSCDEYDLCNSPLGDKILIDPEKCLPRSPSAIRGMAMGYVEQMKSILAGSKYVFIISGLGGSIGSGLSPLLAKVAKESKATVVSIMAMPFKFEKQRHFHAGVALRKIREISDAVIIVDNDSLPEKVPKEPLLDVYESINRKISVALNRLIEAPQGKDIGVGLRKFIEIVNQGGYAILSVCESLKATEEAVDGVGRTIYQIADPNQASKAILCLMSNGITTEEVATSVDRLGALFGNGSIEIQYGISISNGPGVKAILLTSGFMDTKFCDYDPMTRILYDLDKDLDVGLRVELPNMTYLDA